jgi:hypothetical protein
MNNESVIELLDAATTPATKGLGKMPDYEQERLEAQLDAESDPVHLPEVEAWLDLEEALSFVQVSEAVRTECERELADAQARGWRV